MMLSWLLEWWNDAPLPELYAATLVVLLLASEIGYQGGYFHNRNVAAAARRSTVGPVAAAVLGLLAFMLAFTFGNAGSRFAERRQLVIEEANAIGTAYLRTQLVPDPQGAATRELLRKYVDSRIEIVKVPEAASFDSLLAQVDVMHAQIWSRVAELARQYPDSVAVGLFTSAVNDVIDLHSRRVAVGLHNRIAPTIWLTLHFLTTIAVVLMGFDAGMTRSRNMPAMIALVLAFSAVVLLIIDLDRPRQTVFHVGQEAMIDLQKSLARKP